MVLAAAIRASGTSVDSLINAIKGISGTARGGLDEVSGWSNFRAKIDNLDLTTPGKQQLSATEISDLDKIIESIEAAGKNNKHIKDAFDRSSTFKNLKALRAKNVPVGGGAGGGAAAGTAGDVPKIADDMKGKDATSDNLAGLTKDADAAKLLSESGTRFSKNGDAIVFKVNGQRISIKHLQKMSAAQLKLISKLPVKASMWQKIGGFVQAWALPLVMLGVMLPGLIFMLKDRSSSGDGNGNGNGEASENCKATTVTGICSLDEMIQNLFPNLSPGDALLYFGGGLGLCLCLCCCCSCMMSMMMAMSSSKGGNSYNS